MALKTEFRPLTDLRRGAISRLLLESYQGAPEIIEHEQTSWKEFDDFIHDNPETAGRAGFVSLYGEEAVGFMSWDPRGFPEYAVIGHNCVLPAYHGQGVGKRQIGRLLRILMEQKFKTVRVSTGTGDFFAPARRMYIAAGFMESGRRPHPEIPGMEVVEYGLTLS